MNSCSSKRIFAYGLFLSHGAGRFEMCEYMEGLEIRNNGTLVRLMFFSGFMSRKVRVMSPRISGSFSFLSKIFLTHFPFKMLGKFLGCRKRQVSTIRHLGHAPPPKTEKKRFYA